MILETEVFRNCSQLISKFVTNGFATQLNQTLSLDKITTNYSTHHPHPSYLASLTHSSQGVVHGL